MFSYFWNFELHLAVLALAFESFAGIVELAIAVWLAAVRKEEKTAEVEHRKERLENAFSIIAALFFIVAVAVTWRIIVLQSAHEKNLDTQKERYESELTLSSNRWQTAIRQLNAQSNALVAAKIKPFKERLIDCLNSIDPQLVPSLQTNGVHFSGKVTPNKYNAVRSLSEEPGADEYIIFKVDEAFTLIGGQGQMNNLDIMVSSDLVK